MTFYGGAMVALVIFLVFAKWVYPPPSRRKLFDIAAILSAFACSILRLACFAGGCCWGRVTSFWGAVRYTDHRSVMPYLGVPVHPVQIYDSLANLFLAIFLIHLYRRGIWAGQLPLVFFAGYAGLRFATEFFRGDSFRGEDIVLGLSTSQSISCAIMVGFLVWLFAVKRRLA